MRIPRVPRHLVSLGLAALLAALLVGTTGGSTTRGRAAGSSAAAWVGLVGDARPTVPIGQRMLVVLKTPSLSERVAAAGGRASDAEHRRWTSRAIAAQKLVISRLNLQGVPIDPEFTYSRVINGFSAALDPRTVALVEAAPEVRGVYPVRAAYPASVAQRELEGESFAPGAGRRPDVALPGFDGRGVTIALLDTGVDGAQPYLAGRIRGGVDLLGDSDSEEAPAAAKPDNPAQLERHGTELAGILVGAGGPAELAGVATGASILPIRIGGWQRDATGAFAVYSRTDQIIAGLERAVDPNDDGDAHDAARVAVVGMVEPYAAFANGPVARAAAGAARLDTLVVVPAGNDGIAGPGYGSISGPGGAPAALTVGAADLRREHGEVRVTLRSGLNVVYDRVTPLAGSVAPRRPVNLAVATPRIFDPSSPPSQQGLALGLVDFFDDRGFSRVAGRAAFVPAGPDVRRLARDAALSGAAAVVLYGDPIPPGALGLDEDVAVPVVRVPADAARVVLAAAARGASVGVSIGRVTAVRNESAVRVAPFSSRGLAFDGRVKPELVAAGVGVATGEPGGNRYGTINGSSAAAAIVGGAAALLAQARPDLDASGLKSVLVGSARRLSDTPAAAQGAGLVDVEAAAATELAADPSTLALGRATVRGFIAVRRVTVRNLSLRPLVLDLAIRRQGFGAADTVFEVDPQELRLEPGQAARIRVEARVAEPTRGGPPAQGAVVVSPSAGMPIQIPFSLAFGPRRPPLLKNVRLSQRAFRPSDAKPVVLQLQAGDVRAAPGGRLEIEPVARLDVELFTEEFERIGVLARRRDALPGWYTFGITGRDAEGDLLPPGKYRLRLVAFPTGGGPPTRKQLTFTIR